MGNQYIAEQIMGKVVEGPKPGAETTKFLMELDRRTMARVYRDEIKRLYGAE